MVVAIGGSAGGLEAFRGLIAGLPPRSGIAYILVQHLDPDHPSMLADLLAETTPFPVVEISDGMPLLPDRMHVIPAGGRIAVTGARLRLIPSKQNHEGPRLPVDYLLHSLALETGMRVVAVLLSGNGGDGSDGVCAVHGAGGYIIAQDPEEAGHKGMPDAAIATGCVDAILPVAAMGAAIIALRDQLPLPVMMAKDWVEPVLDRLKKGGHDFSGYKIGTMQRRIERRARMAGLGLENGTDVLAAYVARLENDTKELEALANDLLINVTGFFRDSAVFATLATKILPDLVRHHDENRPIRIWCAGCSSGEEAWSLAILFLEEIAKSRPTLKIQLFATDLDPDAIAAARYGLCPSSIESDVSASRLRRFFVADDAGWRVGRDLQASVVFAVHDLLTDPPFSRIDMVSCRNLLIYLQPAAQARAISLFHFALRSGGLLLLGKAEAVMPPSSGAPLFSALSQQAHLYQRNANGASLPAPPANTGQIWSVQGKTANAPPWPVSSLPSARLQALEAELASIRAELSDADLHPGSASTEQKIIDAETLARNQEYQSANEELITSQEELQSLNEELVALNGQLQETVDRQRTTADDLQNILYSTNIATIFLDLLSNIRFFTPATRALFKMLPEDIGRPLADLAPLTPDPHLLSDIGAVLIDHRPAGQDLETTAGICLRRKVMPYRSADNRIEGVVITYSDITEAKRASQAMQEARELADAANMAKSRFLATASHDLRQPLQALVLLQELMARKFSDLETGLLLAQLDQTLQSMSGMLNGLLDINRIEAGAVQSEMTEFALGPFLAGIVEGQRAQAESQGLNLRYVPVSCDVVSDSTLLAGMVQNLLVNALKFTTTGGVLLGARRRGQHIEIQVWDSGVGIAAEDIPDIFQPYNKLTVPDGPGAIERNSGLGLGLSIVSSYGEILDHDVKARSWLGKGSVFSICVPLAASSDPPASDAVPAAPPASQTSAEPVPAIVAAHILVIDDDRKLLDLIARILRDVGYIVAQAGDKAEAMAALKTQTPHLIISDFRLHGNTDGLELAHLLRTSVLASEGLPVPVIILTGDISVESLLRFANEDCVRLTKPVRADALLDAVSTALATATPFSQGTKKLSVAPRSLIHVIDDDTALLRELALLIAEAGLPARLHESSEAFRAGWVPAETGCLLVDAFLPGETGLALIQDLKANNILPPAIMITGQGDVGMAVAAMKAGAFDFIEKPASGPVIIESIRRALASGDNRTLQNDGREAAGRRLTTLTGRQLEVLKLVLDGHPSKNIASDLKVSQRTVENHRAEIMHRTGCRSIPELARLVMTAGPDALLRL